MQAYENLSPASKVWIYQANRAFTDAEIEQLQPTLERFAAQWVSHNRQLAAYARLYHKRFIVLMVDETHADASGCSIDKSVAFLKEIQAAFGVELFDRMNFAYQHGDEVIGLSRDEMQEKIDSGEIQGDTLVFDNLIKTKAEFEAGWLKPLQQSWHARLFELNKNVNTA
jgi:hypothetical protein